MSRSENPTFGEQVGAMYGNTTNMLLYDTLVGENIHIGFWANENDQSSLEQAQNQFTDLFIEKLHAEPASRLLDAGCGIGAPTLRIARATGTHIVGVSVSEGQIERARKKATEQGLSKQVTFQHADMTNLPFESSAFDHAYAIESIMHIPGRISALSEISRVLKPGGHFVFSDIVTKDELSSQEEQLISDWYTEFVALDSLMESLQTAGLVVIRSLNITSNITPTFSLSRENLRLHHDDLINKGISAEALLLFRQNFGQVSKILEQKVEHLLVTAQKPG
jgi:27-O-demethylrifamycin SV methyltransferase